MQSTIDYYSVWNVNFISLPTPTQPLQCKYAHIQAHCFACVNHHRHDLNLPRPLTLKMSPQEVTDKKMLKSGLRLSTWSLQASSVVMKLLTLMKLINSETDVEPNCAKLRKTLDNLQRHSWDKHAFFWSLLNIRVLWHWWITFLCNQRQNELPEPLLPRSNWSLNWSNDYFNLFFKKMYHAFVYLVHL